MDADARETSGTGQHERRLDSWKAIAAHLNRHVTTVRRWEKTEGLPVHRHLHDKLGSVYAFPEELDAWWRGRRQRLGEPDAGLDARVPDDSGASGISRLPAASVGPVLDPRPHAYTGGAQLRRVTITRVAAGAAAAAVIAAVAVGNLVRGVVRDDLDRPITSVAVFPLDNLSGDPAQDYLAEGLSEAVLSRLTRIGALRVISRTSAEALKTSGRRLPEIAAMVEVDAVIQGSMQRAGDRVRVALRLVDARTDTHLWARDFERGVLELADLQSELAEAVGMQVRVRLTPDERARLVSAQTSSPAAQQEYLVGRYHLWRDADEHLERAIAHFRRAIELDPDFAAAHASLAHAWWKRGLWGRGLDAVEAPARAAADAALRLDDSLPEAYVVQADLARLYDHDLARAERLVTRALALERNNVDAHYTYGLILMTMGRADEAVSQMEAAEALDPLSPAVQSDFGRVLYRAGRYPDAIRRLNRALELEPGIGWLVYERLADVHEQLGEYERALDLLRRAERDGAQPDAPRARLLARMGLRQEAERLLGEIESTSGAHPVAMAAAYMTLQDVDRAFTLLFQMTDRAEPGPIFVAVDPLFEPLRSDRRWPALLRRLNTPRAAQGVS